MKYVLEIHVPEVAGDDLSATGDVPQVAGTLIAPDGAESQFWGWLELLRLFEDAVGGSGGSAEATEGQR